MRVFKEVQAFRQWWLLLILGSALLGTLIKLFLSYENTDSGIWKILSFLIVLTVVVLFWMLRLHTKIDARGIKARFEPISIFRKEFKWNEISSCYVRKYSPVREYGGWGVRGLWKAKAYNVSGYMGIQIVTKDQKKFLIGTKKPEDAKKVISRYQYKINEI